MSVVKFGHMEDGGWTASDLEYLSKADLAGNLTPGEIAWKAQHSIPACDLARWARVGRTVNETLELLNGEGDGGERCPAVAAP